MIVTSDWHLGIPAPWAWCTEADRNRCVALLQSLPDDEQVVVAGDLFEDWVWSYNTRPPSMREVLLDDFVAPVLETLRNLQRLVIVVGNHDQDLTPALAADFLPNAKFCSESYRDTDVLIEHGHRHALFCAPDPSTPDLLPLGYWVSRLSASAPSRPDRMDVVRELLDMAVRNESLPVALLDAMRRHSGLEWSDVVLMPASSAWGDCVPLSRVRDAYCDLVSRWRVAHGPMSVFPAVLAEIGELALGAMTSAEARSAKLVVCGHTHKDVENDWPIGQHYINTGTMLGPKPTYVRIDERGARIETDQ